MSHYVERCLVDDNGVRHIPGCHGSTGCTCHHTTQLETKTEDVQLSEEQIKAAEEKLQMILQEAENTTIPAPVEPKEKVAFEYRGLTCATHGQSAHYRVRQKAKRHAGELSPPPKPWVCTFCFPIYPHL